MAAEAAGTEQMGLANAAVKAADAAATATHGDAEARVIEARFEAESTGLALMKDGELGDLLRDHYRGEAQTLTTGAEENLLKNLRACRAVQQTTNTRAGCQCDTDGPRPS